MKTAYELSCGAYDQVVNQDIILTLWKEHRLYHVRLHDLRLGMRVMWNAYNKLTDARSQYRQIALALWPLT